MWCPHQKHHHNLRPPLLSPLLSLFLLASLTLALVLCLLLFSPLALLLLLMLLFPFRALLSLLLFRASSGPPTQVRVTPTTPSDGKRLFDTDWERQSGTTSNPRLRNLCCLSLSLRSFFPRLGSLILRAGVSASPPLLLLLLVLLLLPPRNPLASPPGASVSPRPRSSPSCVRGCGSVGLRGLRAFACLLFFLVSPPNPKSLVSLPVSITSVLLSG